MRNFRSTGLVAGLVLVVAVCGAEALARHEGFADPLLYRAMQSSYELAPSQHTELLGKVTRINALGTRGDDVSATPPSGTWRIMVLGDSVPNGGSQLRDSQTFPAVASDRLNHGGCRAQILNASAGGWSLFDEATWVRLHGVAGATTLVWTINSLDLDQPPSSAAILDHNPSFPSHKPVTALGAILSRYVLPRIALGSSAADNGSSAGPNFDNAQFAAASQLVTTTAHEMEGRGVHTIVLFHDILGDLTADRKSARDRFLARLNAENILVIQTGLAQAPDAKQFYRDEIHPNARGYAVIGTSLAGVLQQQCPKAPA